MLIQPLKPTSPKKRHFFNICLDLLCDSMLVDGEMTLQQHQETLCTGFNLLICIFGHVYFTPEEVNLCGPPLNELLMQPSYQTLN